MVDLTQVLAGPYATYQLALLGADVVKVEIPAGEWLRRSGPPGALRDAGIGAGFLAQGGGKRMVAVDIRRPDGMQILRRLLGEADVFVENMTPGTLAGLGLDEAALRALNPRLVYASISGFGQDGPFSPFPAYDHVIQAMSGLMSVIGTPEAAPLRIGPPMIDYLTGLHAAFAIMAALAARDRHGGFQRLDVAMLDCALAGMSSVVSAYVNAGAIPRPVGNTPASDSPSAGVFDTADGKLALAANTEKQFALLAAALGREEWRADPRFADPAARAANADAMRAEIGAALQARPAAAWEALLMRQDVPAGRVRSIPEAVAEEQVAVRGLLHRRGAVALPGTAFKLNGATLGPDAAPGAVGTDTAAVLARLGYDPARIAALAAAGVIGVSPPPE